MRKLTQILRGIKRGGDNVAILGLGAVVATLLWLINLLDPKVGSTLRSGTLEE